ESAGEERGRESSAERLRAVLDVEEVLRVVLVDQEPRAEAARVAIGDAAPVLELEHGALVRRGRVPEPAGHAQVDEEHVAALEADDDVLPAAFDRRDPVAA